MDKIATVDLTSAPHLAESPSSVSSVKPMTQNIHMMGSEDGKIRTKTSYAKVLEDLGFPVQVSTSVVSKLISISLFNVVQQILLDTNMILTHLCCINVVIFK